MHSNKKYAMSKPESFIYLILDCAFTVLHLNQTYILEQLPITYIIFCQTLIQEEEFLYYLGGG